VEGSPGFDAGAGSRRPLINYATRDVAPPSFVYVNQDDQFILSTVAKFGMTVQWDGRILLPDGTISAFSQAMPDVGDGTTHFLVLPLPEGFLLSLNCSVLDSIFRGQCYARASIRRGFGGAAPLIEEVLVSGYPTTLYFLSWPTTQPEAPTAGAPDIRDIAGTTPGAGADIAETVGFRRRWRLRSFKARFVTSAAVANRFPHLILDDGANTFVNVPPQAAQAATATVDYVWAPGLPQPVLIDGVAMGPLPTEWPMASGWRVRTLTTNIQGADQWSVVRYEVEEWMDF
jgi:hypothetical protein